MIRFLITTVYMPYENLQVMYLWLKMELQINKKKWWFFGNLETCPLVPLSQRKAWLCIFALHRIVFSQYIEICTLLCLNLSWHCTVPHVLISVQIGLIAHWCLIGAEGPDLFYGADQWWHGAAGGCSVSCARLWVGHSWNCQFAITSKQS